MAKVREIVFTRFERFSHWTQAALIILLMITGFEGKRCLYAARI